MGRMMVALVLLQAVWAVSVGALPQGKPQVQNRAQLEIVIERNLSDSNIRTTGGRLVTLDYGPYEVDGESMTGNTIVRNLRKPCEKCFITAMEADLVNERGESMNVKDGSWLHHIVLAQEQLGTISDLICNKLPSARIFSSGNERVTKRFNVKGLKYGVQVYQGSSFGMVYDISNDSADKRKYFVRMKYEVTSDTDTDHKPVAVAWIDAAGVCGIKEAEAKDGHYDLINNPAWTSSISGRLLSTSGHGHDGVTNVQLLINQKSVCDSEILYGTDDAFIQPPGLPKDVKTATPHISATRACIDFGRVQKGDAVQVKAVYDTQVHPLYTKGRHMQGLMGIMVLYVGVDDACTVSSKQGMWSCPPRGWFDFLGISLLS